MGAEIPICLLCHTPRMPRRKGARGFGVAKIIQHVQHPPRRLLRCHRISTTGSRPRDVVSCWSSPGQVVREREIRASCVEPSSTTRAKSREPASPYSGNWCPTRRSGIPARRCDEAKRSLEDAHLEVQAAQNKAIEAAFRVGQAMEKMSQITKLLEANLEPAGQ